MSRIDAAFERALRENARGFIPYFTAGYPDRDTFGAILRAAADAGSLAIEVGIPFSDPIADGPIIQASSEAALRAGVRMGAIFEMIREFRTTHNTPVVLMGYVNPILHHGFDAFVRDAADAGADGVIVPDLPPEDAGDLIAAARGREFATIFLAATTSADERLRRIADASTGYVYFVSRLGVTGVGAAPDESLGRMVDRLRRFTALPIAAGFGVSEPEHVRAVWAQADAAIVGSALVRLIAAQTDRANVASAVARECSRLMGR
ncbi:MAG: tryptophan synthase subunit alpha [Deltaproteobacteria bacterium]|nr:tryptophan synthase subunit alpha [Deltaproteobacteria bacterium]